MQCVFVCSSRTPGMEIHACVHAPVMTECACGKKLLQDTGPVVLHAVWIYVNLGFTPLFLWLCNDSASDATVCSAEEWLLTTYCMSVMIHSWLHNICHFWEVVRHVTAHK